MTVQNELKSLRAKYNFTQRDIANYLNVDIVTYNKKENCKSDFTLLEAKKLSDLFCTSIDNIFLHNKSTKSVHD